MTSTEREKKIADWRNLAVASEALQARALPICAKTTARIIKGTCSIEKKRMVGSISMPAKFPVNIARVYGLMKNKIKPTRNCVSRPEVK